MNINSKKKIAYINLLFNNLPGHDKILKSKAQHFLKSNYSIDFYILNTEFTGFKDNINYIKIHFKKYSIQHIYYYLFKKYMLIEKHINLKNYDLLILRYCLADKSGLSFVKKYNVVTEHHTNEIMEIQSQIKSSRKYWEKIILFIRFIHEKRYGKRILNRCKGIIALTEEIRKFESERANDNLPSVVITNGVNVSDVSMTGFKPYDGKELHIVFVASNLAPWHGIERIVEAIRNYKGHIIINLHLIGDFPVDRFKEKLNKNKIILHGIKTGIELDSLMKNMNIAISTMALYKKSMNEACSLKLREYCARGIPFILAYNDLDLLNVEKENLFFLNFNNDDYSININKILEFVKMINSKKNIDKYMRKYAAVNMDVSVKIKEYYNFIELISESL